MRFMHKVMRLVHGLRYWLGLILLGHTHPTPCRALMWLYVWFAGFFVCVVSLGVIRLPGANPRVMRFLHSLSCMRWVLLYRCVSGCVSVCFFVCVFGHVRARFPYVFPYVSPYPMPYLIPYSESIRTWPKVLSFLLGL